MKNTIRIAFLAMSLLLFMSPIKAQSSKDKKEDKEEKKKTIADVTKSCKKIDGLFPMYQDTAKGNIFMEVRVDQLGKEFIHFFHSENGALNFGWVQGNFGWEKVFKISKYYNKLEFKEQNTNYYFDKESALSKAASANINEPIFSSIKIEVASEKEDTFLIAVDGLFMSEDLAQLDFAFPPGKGPKNPFKKGSMSKDKTKIADIRNYPKNTDVVVDYVFENKRPTNYGLPTVTDARFSTVQIQHTILEMPDNDYQPRYEDPRVGHFTTEVTDQLSKDATPYRDMIHRWHLVKKDPTAALSEPVEPITFWMENTTPEDIRPIIKDAVERWNIAFEKAGFINAVVVKQQPDDADWEAGDVRYNVLRWTATPYMGSAWGPSFVNPRTGQILAADIMLDYVFLRGSENESDLYDIDTRSLEDMIHNESESAHPHKYNQHFCTAGHEAVRKLNFGRTVSTALDYDEAEKSRMVEENLIELLLHEVGHTLGLAHNYISSQMWDNNQIHDRSLTESMGLTSSVMDYNPMNLAVNKKDQGNYQSVTPGPYDKWAIEYAYSPALSDATAEKARLDAILARSTEDKLRFANDADAMFGSTSGIDPRINAWDLTSDAIAYSRDRIAICNNAMNKLMDRMVEDGDSYQKMYHGYRRLLGQQYNALRSTTRYIGGVYIDRNMAGQKENVAPYTPVPAARQKEAMKTVISYGLSPTAFAASGNIYKHLQQQRRGWNFWGRTEDPKILELIGSFQRILLSHIMHPVVLKRMNNSRHYGNTYSVAAMLQDLSQGIFSQDLKSTVNPARQNLQINYTKGLLSGLNSGSYDEISKSAMLYQLNEIRDMMKANKGKNVDTKAHRSHITHLIEQGLDVD